MAPAVELHDVHKTFGEVQALNGLSFEVKEQTVLALLGPNGAGKTTTARLLTTLTKPDQGQIEVFGEDIVANPHHARQFCGLVGQFPSVDENLTGRENLVMTGRLRQLPKATAHKDAAALLDELDLVDVADRAVKTYSGGLKRRIDLGASLMGSPKILILDEPTTGLDPMARRDLWATIRKQVVNGMTIILTTQYLEEADALADEIVLLDKGEKVASGTPDELKARLGGRKLSLTMADATQLQKAAETLPDLEGMDIDQERFILAVGLESGLDQFLDIGTRLRDAGVQIVDISMSQPSLEDVFLNLTERKGEEVDS